ncbi:unnamed protein product [Leuciscus chuanchicus]
MIGRADIEGSKSDVAMNAWPPQASYPCGVPPQSNSPPATVPGTGRRGGDLRRGPPRLDTRSASPPGARLPASPVGFPWSAPVLSRLLGAGRGSAPGGPRAQTPPREGRRPDGGPDASRSCGDPREGPGARPESPPRTAARPPPESPPQRRRHRGPGPPPTAPPTAPRGRPPDGGGEGPSTPGHTDTSDGNGKGRRGSAAPPAAARAQPRFAPQPDRPSP